LLDRLLPRYKAAAVLALKAGGQLKGDAATVVWDTIAAFIINAHEREEARIGADEVDLKAMGAWNRSQGGAWNKPPTVPAAAAAGSGASSRGEQRGLPRTLADMQCFQLQQVRSLAAQLPGIEEAVESCWTDACCQGVRRQGHWQAHRKICCRARGVAKPQQI
jgi:hypothetical protein